MNPIRRNIIFWYNSTLQGITRFLQSKVVTSVRRCKAICLYSNKQCTKSTTYTYCTSHHRIYKEFWKLYHLYNERFYWKQQGVEISDVIETEIVLRERHTRMFQLDPDWGHEKWVLKLKSEQQLYMLQTSEQPSLNLNYSQYEIAQWLRDTYLEKQHQAGPEDDWQDDRCYDIYPNGETFSKKMIFQYYFQHRLDNLHTSGSRLIEALALNNHMNNGSQTQHFLRTNITK